MLLDGDFIHHIKRQQIAEYHLVHVHVDLGLAECGSKISSFDDDIMPVVLSTPRTRLYGSSLLPWFFSDNTSHFVVSIRFLLCSSLTLLCLRSGFVLLMLYFHIVDALF